MTPRLRWYILAAVLPILILALFSCKTRDTPLEVHPLPDVKCDSLYVDQWTSPMTRCIDYELKTVCYSHGRELRCQPLKERGR